MLTQEHYEKLKRSLSISPYRHGPCWKLCEGVCCHEKEDEKNYYYLEFFPFEDKWVSRRQFPRIDKYQVECRFQEDERISCQKTLYCYLSPSHPAFERGVLVGVIIDPELELCPLVHNTNKVSAKFMKAAFQVWSEVLCLLPDERVKYYKKQYRRFLSSKKVRKVWKFV